MSWAMANLSLDLRPTIVKQGDLGLVCESGVCGRQLSQNNPLNHTKPESRLIFSFRVISWIDSQT